MKQRLLTICPKESTDEIMQAFFRWYECDRSKQKSYYDYRRHSLTQKYRGTPFNGLTVAHVLEKLKTKPLDQMTIELATRRQAAGQGPLREMHYLLSVLNPETLNVTGGQEQRTPLHWAIVKGLPVRAILLLKNGAKPDIPDKSKKTAKQYYNESTNKELLDNAVLKKYLAL
jgi:hypothetical protein